MPGVLVAAGSTGAGVVLFDELLVPALVVGTIPIVGGVRVVGLAS